MNTQISIKIQKESLIENVLLGFRDGCTKKSRAASPLELDALLDCPRNPPEINIYVCPWLLQGSLALSPGEVELVASALWIPHRENPTQTNSCIPNHAISCHSLHTVRSGTPLPRAQSPNHPLFGTNNKLHALILQPMWAPHAVTMWKILSLFPSKFGCGFSTIPKLPTHDPGGWKVWWCWKKSVELFFLLSREKRKIEGGIKVYWNSLLLCHSPRRLQTNFVLVEGMFLEWEN